MLELIYKGELEVPAKKYQRFRQISNSLSIKGLQIAQVEGGMTSTTSNDQEESAMETFQSEKTTEELATLSAQNICMLPLEIITKILSQLSTYDLLQNLALVSSFLLHFC